VEWFQVRVRVRECVQEQGALSQNAESKHQANTHTATPSPLNSTGSRSDDPTATPSDVTKSPDRKLARITEACSALPPRMPCMQRRLAPDNCTQLDAATAEFKQRDASTAHTDEGHACMPDVRGIVPTRGHLRSLVPRKHRHWQTPEHASRTSAGASSGATPSVPVDTSGVGAVVRRGEGRQQAGHCSLAEELGRNHSTPVRATRRTVHTGPGPGTDIYAFGSSVCGGGSGGGPAQLQQQGKSVVTVVPMPMPVTRSAGRCNTRNTRPRHAKHAKPTRRASSDEEGEESSDEDGCLMASQEDDNLHDPLRRCALCRCTPAITALQNPNLIQLSV
jgi:hypothetical protein